MGVSIVRRRRRVPYLALAALLLASPAAAAGLMRWRTPTGGLYVGDSPPPGSTFVGRTERPAVANEGWADGEDTATPDAEAHAEGETEAPPARTATQSAPKELSPAEIARINHQLRGSADAMLDAGGGNRMPSVPAVPIVPGQP